MTRKKLGAGAALRRCAAAVLSVVVMAATANAADTGKGKKDDPLVERGRYLVQIGGCNDCHTPGYLLNAGNVPESQWLTGDSFGWNGPWGTTYASNLRLYMNQLTEAQWLEKARNLSARPPMPWFNVRKMAADDLTAIYRYIRRAGPAGKPAPAYIAPGTMPPPPYATFPAPPAAKAPAKP